MTAQEFREKVLPLSSQVYPMAKRLLLTNEAAHDAVQQSLMKLWENRKQLKTCTNLKAFTFKVVRNTCLDELKRKRPILFDKLVTKMDERVENENHDQREAVKIVKLIMNELPENQRDVIQMRDIDGLDFEEIADVLSLEITHVRVLLSRARKMVKENLIKIYAYEAKIQQ